MNSVLGRWQKQTFSWKVEETEVTVTELEAATGLARCQTHQFIYKLGFWNICAKYLGAKNTHWRSNKKKDLRTWISHALSPWSIDYSANCDKIWDMDTPYVTHTEERGLT